MKHYATFLLLGALAGCSGTQSTGPTAHGPRPPSSGPRAEDGFDDRALIDFAADVQGRNGDDQSRAELRLATAQTRAFVVAVVHAFPPVRAGAEHTAPSGDGGTEGPRFDPPATLITQLGATTECSAGGVAHGCAGRLGSALLSRLDALHPPADLAAQKASLQASLAALEESRVGIDTATRAHVLDEQQDPGAHLAQAVTLLQIRRHLGMAIAADMPADETSHLAARLSDELAIGPCSDAYEQLVSTDAATATHAIEALRAMANGGCVPACARTALSGTSEDPVLEAARACRTESDAVFAPFESASRSINDWSRAASTRLAAIGNDGAVQAILAAAPEIPTGGHLPMSLSLFVAHGGLAIEVPAVASAAGSEVELGAASAVVWAPPEGNVLIRGTLQFSLDSMPAPTTSSVPIDGIASALSETMEHGDTGHPAALVIDRDLHAARFVSLLQHIPHAASSGTPSPLAGIVGFAVRSGPFSRLVPVRVLDAAPETHLRVGERRIAVVDHGNVTQVITLAPPPASGADLLGGAIPDAAPTGPITVAFEADASGATIVRVIDALAVHGARGSNPSAPQVVAAVGDGALTANVTDAAHAAALRTAVDSHRADAMHCLDAAPADAPAVSRIDLHLVLGARGRITRAEAATHDAPHLQPAATCIQNAARRWRLPDPGVPNAEVHVPYVRDRGAMTASAAPPASPSPSTSRAVRPVPHAPPAHPVPHRTP